MSHSFSLLTSFTTFCSLPVNVCVFFVCVVICVKDYITVTQLSQIFGLQTVDPSSSSSISSFQLASAEAFSRHSTASVPSSSSLRTFVFPGWSYSVSKIQLSATGNQPVFTTTQPVKSSSSFLVYGYLFYSTCLMLDEYWLLLYYLLFTLAWCFSSPQSQPELSRNALPPINLERWYQDIMAAGEPESCPPPLPAKSFSTRRHGQVNS